VKPAASRFPGPASSEFLERATARLKIVIPGTLAIIFVLLYFAFRRVAEALLIMGTLPFALVGGFWLMYVLGYNMSIASAVGSSRSRACRPKSRVMLVYINQRRREAAGRFDERVSRRHRRGRSAARGPVAMTVAVIVAGLLPINVRLGTGSEVMRRIAAPMVGGMLTQRCCRCSSFRRRICCFCAGPGRAHAQVSFTKWKSLINQTERRSEMKYYAAVFAILALSVAFVSVSRARGWAGWVKGMDMGKDKKSRARCTRAQAPVKKVDPAESKVTIEHGPIPTMNGGMNMTFTVKDKRCSTSCFSGQESRFRIRAAGCRLRDHVGEVSDPSHGGSMDPQNTLRPPPSRVDRIPFIRGRHTAPPRQEIRNAARRCFKPARLPLVRPGEHLTGRALRALEPQGRDRRKVLALLGCPEKRRPRLNEPTLDKW